MLSRARTPNRPAAPGGDPGHANPYRAALRRLRPAVITVGLFSALLSLLMLTGSVYMLQVYDRVLASGSVPTLVGLFAIVIVLYGFLGIYDFLRSRMLSRAARQLDLGTGPETFRAWLRSGVPGGAGGGQASGGQAAQPLQDLGILRGFISGPAIVALFDTPFVPLFLAVLFLIHPWLGWLTVAGALVVAGLAGVNRLLTRAAIREAAALDGNERDFTEKGRRNAEAIIAMGMEGALTRRWQALHDRTLTTGERGSDPSEVLASSSRAFRLLLQSAILTLGAWLVLQNQMTAGMIVAASILSGRALAPVDQVIGQWRAIGRALEAHRRLGTFFDERAEAARPRIDLPAPTGQITVSRLTKLAPGWADGRPGAERPRILHQVSFTLEPGDGLGVIGNSASGKSTLARLIMGAWAPDAGEIRLDGATPDQWDPAVLGRSVGYLPQVLDMLPGTIRDNIARFDAQATDRAVIEAAKLAGVHDMILGLPDGYATMLGGTGGAQPLSGGQIQRLGLARAIYGRPRLVVLDEPNSNLDVAGDDALANAIATLRADGATVIVMAHRPSAIAAVNKVLILHNGMVARFGDKDAVLTAMTRGGPALAPVPATPATARATAQEGVQQGTPQPAAVGASPGPARSDPADSAGSEPVFIRAADSRSIAEGIARRVADKLPGKAATPAAPATPGPTAATLATPATLATSPAPAPVEEDAPAAPEARPATVPPLLFRRARHRISG